MPLFVVATPIGNDRDFGVRALDILRSADLVIGEELKALRPLLKAAGVQARKIDQLNEHSTRQDIEHFLAQCRDQTVALVSDCGTPGFCDPGADLVRACRGAGIKVHPVPGASSLMAFLSVAGVRLDSFIFAGFLPPKAEDRTRALKSLTNEKRAVILLETPYRVGRLLEDLAAHFPDRLCTLGLNLTQENELVVEARGRDLKKHTPSGDAEPILLLHQIN